MTDQIVQSQLLDWALRFRPLRINPLNGEAKAYRLSHWHGTRRVLRARKIALAVHLLIAGGAAGLQSVWTSQFHHEVFVRQFCRQVITLSHFVRRQT